MHHEENNCPILSDCSNAFNTVKRTVVLAVAVTCVPSFTPFIEKCYGDRLAPIFFRMDSGGAAKY